MANPSAPYEEWDASKFWHAPARNFRTSARLHLQHTLFQNVIGPNLLDPHVSESLSSSSTPLAIADLGCGNGAWLLDLSRQLVAQDGGKNANARLDGYDINAINFPAAAFLPSNVTLSELNVLSPIPDSLKGIYDVVHIRAFVSCVMNEDTRPILSTALSLLKPGGWLQWEESPPEKFLVESPSPEVSKTNCEMISGIIAAGGKARGSTYKFVRSLDEEFRKNSFGDVHLRVKDKLRSDLKAWTDDYLMVWEELAPHFPLKAKAPQAPMNREMWLDLFSKAVAETEKGVVINQGQIIWAIGRKPL
ncbi:hypothetical protein F5Y16DRAFT_230468 [Xylariaceae sp. FL0255]|nr:hypothetical protein F5Y16DRAFT_230468 [Xylariaceae sp. FL0255]